MECQRFADFKPNLASSMSDGVPFIYRGLESDYKTDDVLFKVVGNAVAAFFQCRYASSTSAIERAAIAL